MAILIVALLTELVEMYSTAVSVVTQYKIGLLLAGITIAAGTRHAVPNNFTGIIILGGSLQELVEVVVFYSDTYK